MVWKIGEDSGIFSVRGFQFQVCFFDGDIVVFESFVYALLQTLALVRFRLVICDTFLEPDNHRSMLSDAALEVDNRRLILFNAALVPDNHRLMPFDVAIKLGNHRLMPFDATLWLGQRNLLDLACRCVCCIGGLTRTLRTISSFLHLINLHYSP